MHFSVGGVNTDENLELIDTEVYWVSSDSTNKTRTLPASASIGQITIE